MAKTLGCIRFIREVVVQETKSRARRPNLAVAVLKQRGITVQAKMKNENNPTFGNDEGCTTSILPTRLDDG